MKLIIAIVQDEDASRLVSALMNDGYGGNTTLLVGVDDNRFELCLHIIEKLCKSRRQMATSPITAGGAVGMYTHMPIEVTVGGATVFVLNVEQFAKF